MKLVVINLPEKNEGRGTRESILVNCDDINAVRKMMQDTQAGVMDTELEKVHFNLVEVVSLKELRKRFRKSR